MNRVALRFHFFRLMNWKKKKNQTRVFPKQTKDISQYHFLGMKEAGSTSFTAWSMVTLHFSSPRIYNFLFDRNIHETRLWFQEILERTLCRGLSPFLSVIKLMACLAGSPGFLWGCFEDGRWHSDRRENWISLLPPLWADCSLRNWPTQERERLLLLAVL